LLPEGKIRKLISQRLGISIENDFALLKALGEDCAGAFRISTHGKLFDDEQYESLPLTRIKKIFETQPIIYLGLTPQEFRLSLAGAQDKVPVKYENNKLYLPLNGAPSTHILKMPSKDYPYLPENEHLVLKLAQDCEMNVNKSLLLQDGKFSTLLVERYDRTSVLINKIERLHQEDFCQAIGISYKNKYEEEGGVSFPQAFELIENESIHVTEDLEQLLKWIFFNVSVGNCDHHGKNLSLLMIKPNRWQLSPFYDLLCTKIYPTLTKKQAMKIGDSLDGGNLSIKNWEILLDRVNYSLNRFTNEICLPIIDTISIGIEQHVDDFRNQNSYEFLKALQKEILTNVRRTREGLRK
jgi:serine/threonine-protein kinase HipA